MKISSNNNNIERLRKITFIICVPFYACTYKENGTKRAEKGYQNRDKFFAEIVSILQADGWTLTTMGETLDCGKSTCPELTKGNEHIYCHPEELTGEVQDEKAFAEILKGAASFRIVKKEAGDIYVCADNEEGKQLYRDTYRDCIDEVIRDVVYLKTNIYGGRKGDWIDLDSATRIIGERIFIATKSNNDEYNSVTVLREYVTEQLCRLQDAGRIEATTNQHGQTVIKWADERTLAYTARCKELEAEALAQMPYKVGDIVKSRDGVTGRVIEMHPEVTGDTDSPHLTYEYDGKPTVNVVILDADGKRHCAHWSFFTLQEESEITDGTEVWTTIELHSEYGKRGKVVRKFFADHGVWCLDIEFEDGTKATYAEEYVTTEKPWAVVGAKCRHKYLDRDVVLTITAVGQYYGIKAESEDGKVKWTGLARDFVPCTPDGRDLLPEPPAEVVIDEPDYYSEYQKLGHQEARPQEWLKKTTNEKREAYYMACVELERMAGDGLPLVIRADSADLSVNPWNALDKRVKTARVFHLGDRVKVKDGGCEVTGIVNGIRCNEGSLALGGWCTHYNIQWDKQYQYTTGYGTATGCGNIGPERIELIERAEFCPEPAAEWLQPGEKVAHYLDNGDGTGDWLTGNVTGYDLDDNGNGVTVIYGEYRTPLKGMVKYQPEMDGKAA